ncbi:hypothetical protein CRUP_007183 [Coryphaenoides rupestris]|nr:hypothetical protein CRUP_007183 [Coryphaenoides rupestris]
MSSLKRRQHAKATGGVFFPGDVTRSVRQVAGSSLTTSAPPSHGRVADSPGRHDDDPVLNITWTSSEIPTSSSHYDTDLLDIAWTSSSESEQLDNDHDPSLAKSGSPRQQERRRKTPKPTTTVEAPADEAVRPGVLPLEVLEVQEECGMQLAHCRHRRPPGGPTGPPPLAARLLVLFSRETAAQLMPAPKDVIHVHPPWQSLDVDDENTTVILNTHFSQKVCSDAKTTNAPTPGAPLPGPLPPAKCAPCALTKTFGLHQVDTVKRQARQVIEGLGQAGSVGPDVRVVVQRVYSTYVPDRPAGSTAKPERPWPRLRPRGAEAGILRGLT